MCNTLEVHYYLKAICRHIQAISLMTGALVRKRNSFYLRVCLTISLLILIFTVLHIDFTHKRKFRKSFINQNSESDSTPAQRILRSIKRYNEEQLIRNDHLFSALQNDSVVIIVQVHNRIEYLQHLISSLSQAKNISSALLIFSHDYYDENINKMVQSINFCRVLQIFYPYSIQTHVHAFPGEDPNDCPRNLQQNLAIERQCKNALHPDSYGHYREAKFTQTKHHWWWKVNRVFDQLHVTRHHTGYVLFLEEDHYVAEDFLHVLMLMQKQVETLCPKCNILSLGTYLDSIDEYTLTHPNEVKAMPWISVKHNMAMAMNRSTWLNIRKCANQFCTYDDYNWDWTLLHISEQCLPEKFHTLVASRPRVFHIGECGLHHEKQSCESDHMVTEVRNVLNTASQSLQLFPQNITLAFSVGFEPDPFLANGGWGDVRDHHLCLNFTAPSDSIKSKNSEA
ncbi:alpha-1,6-mannosyl-glycoprotein 2-beta-N-acetylglucosaminyltransferase-like isoform X2 [Sitodiplosis mosellana]|uniref:alpha-1,6-mannosyl-glycoprotein 2-beta-N-acetylglucosaminyltransferase-like isoform X2 n=1 Tax=Sitodiplosis mosellana TaxID=263140 RepID=UPI002444CFBD|nr:alpha-1,6-mannosyl-glycoprotein 2-beta-N-acetylglucosaminyltransferase-like isoform X2 [Sitodiplosis mosellana]